MNPDESAEVDDADTGLPLLRTWRAVYTFVLAAFVVTLALLDRAHALAYP